MATMDNMPSGLAKISFPRIGRPFLRPRLFQRLDGLLDAPVVWVAGAPGAGKTTLISSYLAERGISALWLQIDAGDVDPASFFHYFSLAIRKAAAGDCPALPVLVPGHMADMASVTRRYADALAACAGRSMAIVFDNYDQAPAQAALHEMLPHLVAALPDGVHLLVISRGAPPPTCARLQMHGDLMHLGGRELDLTADEALGMARQCVDDPAIVLDRGHIARLLDETRGWCAGFALLLAEGGSNARELPERAGRNQQLLFDYFAIELFGQFSEPVRHLLLRTALLPTMTAADAASLSCIADAATILDGLHRQNCFVAQCGQDPPEFECHALFRTFLLKQAAAAMPAADWRALQQLSASLLAQAGRADAAASLYLMARDGQGLSALALREAPALIRQGRHRTLQRWLDGLPQHCLQAAPWLCYWRAVACLPFDPVAARGVFEQAYAGFRGTDDAAGLYSTWAGVMETFFFEWRDFRPADRWISEFECLRLRHPAFPSRTVELLTYWAMGTLLHRQPQHPMLPAWAERAAALLDPAERELSVLLGGYLIIWFLWRGEGAKARGMIERITPWVGGDVPPLVRILWSCAVALYHSVSGACADCQRCVSAALALAEHSGLHTFDFLLSAQMARCSLVAGDIGQAAEWLDRMAATMRSHSHIDGAFYLHLCSNAAAQRGEWQLALDHARHAMAMADESGVPFLVAHCHLDLAHMLPGNGEDAEFAAHIGAARTIGQAMGSRVIEYLCLEAEARAAFRQGHEASGLRSLAAALAVSAAMGGATYQLAGSRAAGALYGRALAAGIAVAHVQNMIRQRGITPEQADTAGDAWPWPVRLCTLGRFELLRDGEPLPSTGKAQHKPLALLKCLIAFGGQAVNQDSVTDALWPDTAGDAADQILRTTLHRLRKLLRHEQVVRLEDRHLSLDPRHAWVDCVRFERASQLARMDDVASLKRTLATYRGPFLPGESAAWALTYRHRLRVRFIGMSEALGDLLERQGDWYGAVACYARALEAEALAENLYRRLMAAYVHLGQRSEALLVYQRCRLALLSGLGVSPAPETLSLYRQLTAQSVSDL